MIILTGQQNNRHCATPAQRFTQQFHAIMLAKAVVEEINIVPTPFHLHQSSVIGRHPLQDILSPADLGQQIASEDIIVFVVIYQQDFYRRIIHTSLHCHHPVAQRYLTSIGPGSSPPQPVSQRSLA